MANTNLQGAKNAKNDEFYTQYYNIEREINAYLEFDPDVFKGKTVLLPCDDPEWSNFSRLLCRLGIPKSYSMGFVTLLQPDV